METENFVQNAMINTDITIDEVEAAVTKLKNGKAIGVDCIPNEVVKKQSVLIWWYRLFQVCFENGLVPSIWRNAIIYPIPKCATKDPFIPLNYRGISLLSCVSKTYSSILNNIIVKYCNLMGIFPEEQNGFRKNRSCQDHIYALTTVIRNRITENKATYCAFIDMEKAFDWVNRKLLMYKLLNYNIDGKMYKSIKALLTNTTSCVELNGSLRSEWFENICGVRQGDCLSPTLFSLYINDLAVHLKDYGPTIDLNGVHINSLLYADDLVIVAETEDQLQNLLNLVYNWCLTWRLKVNNDKTNIVHFRPTRQQKTNYDFKYGEHAITMTHEYKYLGIILDEHLKFDSCIAALASAGGRALGAIISKFKELKNVSYNTYTKLYNSGVAPILEYSCAVWPCAKANEIDIIQNRAMRYFLGVHKYAPNAGSIGDMGWIKHCYSRYLCAFRFWNRLLNMEDSRLTKQILY